MMPDVRNRHETAPDLCILLLYDVFYARLIQVGNQRNFI